MKMSLKSFGSSVGGFVVSCTLLAGVSAHAGLLTVTDPGDKPPKKKTASKSGGAHNGPVTSGDAVPPISDRGILLEDLNQTMVSCFGDFELSLLKQISHGLRLSSADFLQVQWTRGRTWGGQHYPVLNAHLSRYFQATTTLYQLGAPNDDPAHYNYARMQFSVDAKYGNDNDVFANIPMPVVFFDDTFSEGKVDELGRNDYSKVAVKNLRIVYPKNTPDQFFMVNLETGNPTAVNVNLRAYYDCLVSGVQQ